VLVNRLRTGSSLICYGFLHHVNKQPVYLFQFVDQQQFYLPLDTSLLLDMFKTDAQYLAGNWGMLGRPLIVFPIKTAFLGLSVHLSVCLSMSACICLTNCMTSTCIVELPITYHQTFPQYYEVLVNFYYKNLWWKKFTYSCVIRTDRRNYI